MVLLVYLLENLTIKHHWPDFYRHKEKELTKVLFLQKKRIYSAIIVTFLFGKIAWCNHKQVQLSHLKSERK